MVVPRLWGTRKSLCLLALSLLLLGSSILPRAALGHVTAAPAAAPAQPTTTGGRAPSSSYLDAYGKYSAVADRLAQLLEAEEPLQPEHVERLAAAVK
jgi:hypothetical protein